MDAQIEIGQILWALPIKNQVKVIDISILWNTTNIKVIDTENKIHHFYPEDLISLEDVPENINMHNRIVNLTSSSKLDHHLNLSDTITAHISTGLIILPHQIKHLEDALMNNTTRLLLADEVGLGKTITAGLILTELKNRGLIDRVLIVCPAGIVPQWIQEMKNHFLLYFTPVFTDLSPTPENESVWVRYSYVVTSYDAIKPLQKRRGWTKDRLAEYNRYRFEGVTEVPWDLVIIDEAHRVSGSKAGVARNALARGLSTISPNFLLLTGTPHQGKIDQFHRLVQLLDADTFSTPETVTRENLKRHVLRTDKKNSITFEGLPLFVERSTKLIAIPKNMQDDLHIELYNETIDYIKTGYSASEKESRKGLGFLMVLVQRLLSSSVVALEETLRNRLSTINDCHEDLEDLDLELIDQDKDIHEESILVKSFDKDFEINKINMLLDLIERCKLKGPDPKANYVLELLKEIQIKENNPNTKILIFTEFQSTQKMLKDFLITHGYNVTILNGSMKIEERVQVQKEFEADAQIMISTEAGGEGLNLQFCHIVINYDLPWNPMRIEQRIGRVHRIGQNHEVSAYNLVLEDTIEHRVVEVLGEKLQQIMKQLGIEKLSDILDTPEIEEDIYSIYKKVTQQNNNSSDNEILNLLENIRNRAETIKREMNIEETVLDLEKIKIRLQAPVDFWLRQFVDSSNENILPDLRESHIRKMISKIPIFAPDTPIPIINIKDIETKVQGLWALWKIGITDGTGKEVRNYCPIFEIKDGNIVFSSAIKIYDYLLQGKFDIIGYTSVNESKSIHENIKEKAIGELKGIYDSIVKEYHDTLSEDLRRHEDGIRARKNAIMALGLEEVRRYRISKLEDEDKDWKTKHKERYKIFPILDPVLIVRIGG